MINYLYNVIKNLTQSPINHKSASLSTFLQKNSSTFRFTHKTIRLFPPFLPPNTSCMSRSLYLLRCHKRNENVKTPKHMYYVYTTKEQYEIYVCALIQILFAYPP